MRWKRGMKDGEKENVKRQSQAKMMRRKMKDLWYCAAKLKIKLDLWKWEE